MSKLGLRISGADGPVPDKPVAQQSPRNQNVVKAADDLKKGITALPIPPKSAQPLTSPNKVNQSSPFATSVYNKVPDVADGEEKKYKDEFDRYKNGNEFNPNYSSYSITKVQKELDEQIIVRNTVNLKVKESPTDTSLRYKLEYINKKIKFLEELTGKNNNQVQTTNMNTANVLPTNLFIKLGFNSANTSALRITDYIITPNNNSLYSIIAYVFSLFKQN
jgi:hypothetical protein